MAWFSRITRFGDVHMVYGQEAGMSCGIASVLMCVFKINKLSPGKQAVQIESDVYNAYSTASGAQYKPEKRGTHPTHLVTVLNGLNCGKWTWSNKAGVDASKFIIEKVGICGGLGPTVDCNPIIVGVDWDGGGAHWIVIDTIRDFFGSKYSTVCDPWDANVHVEKISRSKAFEYTPGDGGFSVDFWGEHKGQSSPYGETDRGLVKTWGIIHRI